MLISGVQPFTLLDYPDKVAAIIFTPGCNMRCRFCHNKEFVLPKEIKKMRPSFISEKTILNFLSTRKGKLDGLVISGGEPTIQPDLKQFIIKVRELGFLIKLDTNGNLPHILKDLIHEKLVDYVAMDVKTTLANYTELVGNMANPIKIKESIDFLKKNLVPYEFRTTMIENVHTEQIVNEMAQLLAGAHTLYIQTFRPEVTLDPAFKKKRPLPQETIERYIAIFKSHNITNVTGRQ